MISFDSLPFDAIYYILNSDSLSYIELCRLSCVSKTFNSITKSNKLWKRKYSLMWPELADLFGVQNVDWKDELRTRVELKKLISEKLLELSEQFYYYENVSNEAFLYFKDIVRNHPFGYEIVIDELQSIVNDSGHQNLTKKYYAERALRYMRHAQLEIKWKDYLSRPASKMSLVEGACLISQWCQPTTSKCTSHVLSQIEDITRRVFEKVQELFPNHPVTKQGISKEDMIASSLWTPRQCKDILYCINAVLFQELKFSGNEMEDYSSDTTNIDKVLTKRTGHSISQGIIYAAIAAKLGVCCLPVNFPGHFLLKWMEYPGMEEKESYTFIDVINKGAFLKYDQLTDLVPGFETFTPSWAETSSPIKVFIRLAWYLVEFGRQVEGGGEDSLYLCNALELLCHLSPDDMEHKLLLARLFMHLGINISEAISMLQDIAAHDPPLSMGYMYQSTLNNLEAQKLSQPLIKHKVRKRDESKNVKFAVGMIMRHLEYNYRCVIYGWDEKCSASTDWKRRMGVNYLQFQEFQPFYYVLVDDGTNRYAAQENLEIDRKNKPIPHSKVGRYFESFHGIYYSPNEQTLSEYPDDNVAREKALQHLDEEMSCSGSC